jgi:hypothetical protein
MAASHRRLGAVAAHLQGAGAPLQPQHVAQLQGPLAGLEDATAIRARYQCDGYVVVRNFLAGSALKEAQDELASYIREVIPTKSTDEHYFDGEWSVEGARGPTSALKYINIMTERSFFADCPGPPGAFKRP